MLDSKFDDLSHEKPDIWGSLVQSVIKIALSKGYHLEKDQSIIRQLSKLEKMNVIPHHLHDDVADTMIRQYQLNERAGRSN
jgi:type III secretion system FlhB-like substrate exporter